MARPDKFSSSNAQKSTGNSCANPDLPEGPPPLYPPLNISEPYITDKKRAVMMSTLKYKHIIDDVRKRYTGEDFKSHGLFQIPDLGPPKSVSSKAKRKVKVVTLEKAGDDAEKEADTEDEDKPATAAKSKGDDDEDVEPSDDEDDENQAAKSDSDIDDYTVNAGFDDDEMNFEVGDGGDADNDAHIF